MEMQLLLSNVPQPVKMSVSSQANQLLTAVNYLVLLIVIHESQVKLHFPVFGFLVLICTRTSRFEFFFTTDWESFFFYVEVIY